MAEELTTASQFLHEIGLHKDTKHGALEILKTLHEMGIQVKGQKPFGRGVTLFISRSDAEAFKAKRAQQVKEQKRGDRGDCHDLQDAAVPVTNALLHQIITSLIAIASELGIELCDSCGAKRPDNKTIECPHCGSWSEP